MQKITPFLWFKDNAEEAMEFYTKLFADSKVVSVTKMADNIPPQGKALIGVFELMGQRYMCINGGENPMLAQAGPLSLVVPCDTQEEIDKLWSAFSEGGTPIMCGWITDKFGITWQVTPSMMDELMDASADPERAKRVGAAMMQMVKLDIAQLRAAAEGK